jgi:SAM-dependent methyltransferase
MTDPPSAGPPSAGPPMAGPPLTGQPSVTATRVRQLFDAKASTWPDKYAPGGPLRRRLGRLVGTVAYHVPAGGTVLDLGCGTGELTAAIAAAGLRATGCDISARMLSLATAARGAAGWVQLDPAWQVLPFRPEAFDAVVASSVLEYVDQPSAVLRECRRVLRPGGIMVCTVPDVRHPVRWLETLAGAAARVPAVSAACASRPPLDGYVAYLQCSVHRRPVRWWHAHAVLAGLCPATCTHDGAPTSPLRTLTFHRPCYAQPTR